VIGDRVPVLGTRTSSPLQVVAVVGALAVGASTVAAEETRGPSTPEERARVLESVELLESTPTAPGAKEAIPWLVAFLANVPDIEVILCLRPLGPPAALEDVPSQLTVQQAFSQAAFHIRNPGVESGSVESYVAGVRGSLRAYDAMRATGEVPELEAFESLKRDEAAGKLEKVVKRRAKKCG
jgi:hypothetical protein